jgi:branched-chain amino acid transport system ATP-binding protein
MVAVIGANGAGKSTLLNTIAGVVSYSSGSIKLAGQPLPRQSFQVVKRGCNAGARGSARIFAPLTVRENLRLGAFTRTDAAGIAEAMERVFELFPVLRERINQLGGTLSGGEQQMLAVGRALMSNPRLLLLDEPSMGLAPLLVDSLFDAVIRLNETSGLTILLVEQNASLALSISHRAYVLKTGQIIMEGEGHELANDPRVRESYLGVSG